MPINPPSGASVRQAREHPGRTAHNEAALHRRYEVALLQQARLGQVLERPATLRDYVKMTLLDARQQQFIDDSLGHRNVWNEEVNSPHRNLPVTYGDRWSDNVLKSARPSI